MKKLKVRYGGVRDSRDTGMYGCPSALGHDESGRNMAGIRQLTVKYLTGHGSLAINLHLVPQATRTRQGHKHVKLFVSRWPLFPDSLPAPSHITSHISTQRNELDKPLDANIGL